METIDPADNFEAAVEQIARQVVERLRAYLPPDLEPLERARRRLARAGRHYAWAVETGLPVFLERARPLLDERAREFVQLLEEQAGEP